MVGKRKSLRFHRASVDHRCDRAGGPNDINHGTATSLSDLEQNSAMCRNHVKQMLSLEEHLFDLIEHSREGELLARNFSARFAHGPSPCAI